MGSVREESRATLWYELMWKIIEEKTRRRGVRFKKQQSIADFTADSN